jgi:hypothetical protein
MEGSDSLGSSLVVVLMPEAATERSAVEAEAVWLIDGATRGIGGRGALPVGADAERHLRQLVFACATRLSLLLRTTVDATRESIFRGVVLW